MEAFLLISRLTLAGVFATAGIAKLADRAGSEKAIADFGLPQNLAKPLAIILPLVEIAAAILLLPVGTAWFGALVALGLLLAFVGGIIYNMAQGRAPDCHCFGQIHSEPVGWSVLFRNLLLTAIAAFVVFTGRENAGMSAFSWFTELSTGERMQLFVGLLICGLLAAIFLSLRQVLKNQIVLQRQIEVLELTTNEEGKREVEREDVKKPSPGLPVGAIAPDFDAVDLNGKRVTLEHLLMRGKPLVLFFVSPTCNPCQAMTHLFDKWHRELNPKLSVILVSNGEKEENAKKFDRFEDGKTVLLQKGREIALQYRAPWTPAAVLINADGSIGSMLATGDREIMDLMDLIRPTVIEAIRANGNGHQIGNFLILPKKKQETLAPKAGDLAPDFTLPSLDGREISLSDFRGMKTLLLFWRATCPFCQEIANDLRDWEASQEEFKLVVIANNEPEIETARAFKSTVLIESNLQIQRLFDFDGTPGGLLIDEEGRIVSDIVAGAEDVFALVGYSPKK